MSFFKYFPKVKYKIDTETEQRTMVNLAATINVDVERLDRIAFYAYYNVVDGERPENISYKLYGSTNYYWTFFIINQHLRNYYDHWPKSSSELVQYCQAKYPYKAALFEPTVNLLAGKYELGELVQGQQSGATGYIRAKYPTDGYIFIEPVSGTFKASGESIVGLQTEDSVPYTAVVDGFYAPHYHTEITTGDITSKRTAGTVPYTHYEYESDKNLEYSRIRVIKPQYIKRIASEFIAEMNKK